MYITYGTTVPGTLLDRVVSIGESPLKCVFRKCGHKEFILKDGIDGHVYSIRLQLHSRNYVDRNSEEHFKYNDICYDVKYAFISFYSTIMFYSFNYYRCTICIYA